MLSIWLHRDEVFLGHAQHRCEKHVDQQRGEHTRLPKTLFHIEHVQALAILQTRARSAVVELEDDVEHYWWHAKAS